jgi:hypothetical protein
VVQSGISQSSPARGRFCLAVRNSRDSRRRKAARPSRSTSVSPLGDISAASLREAASGSSLGIASISNLPY